MKNAKLDIQLKKTMMQWYP